MPSPLLMLALSACLDPSRHLEPHEEADTAPFEEAGAESRRLPTDAMFETLADDLDEAWASHPNRRAYLQTDKPLYRPGETLWFRAFDLSDGSLSGEEAFPVTAELVNPRGAVVLSKRLKNAKGNAHNDMVIPATVSGGRYVLRLTQVDQPTVERPVILATYETPRIQKDLDFVREAYGPGDTVQASLELKRPTGEPLAHGAYTAVVDLDGSELTRVDVGTDALGKAVVRFDLPNAIDRGDALVTVLVADGGVTESISRRVPIVLNKVELGLFPEGGDLVQGLPGRVYLRSTSPLGEPADVAGRVLDDQGAEVASFRTVKDGLGRFDLQPEAGRTYHVVIDEPVGIEGSFEVPEARGEGCVMKVYDDFESELDSVRAGLRCTDAREITVQGVIRENRLDAATVAVVPFEESLVYLEEADARQGVVRVTAFDGIDPVAERLVYRNLGRDLQVEVTPRQEVVGPRQEVVLDVRTTTPSGEPVAASLALAVVDETVLSYADDEEPHMLTALHLKAELPEPLHDPNPHFDEPGGAQALDLVLGTAGWRRFDWQAALVPPPHLARLKQERQWADQVVERKGGFLEAARGVIDDLDGAFLRRAANQEVPMVEMAAPPMDALAAPMGGAAMGQVGEGAAAPVEADPVGADGAEVLLPDREMDEDMRGPALQGLGYLMPEKREKAKNDWVGDNRQAMAWAPVREFPVPVYSSSYEGLRTDFRETIYWAPELQTDARGKAVVRFPASDAVTSFRVTTEGVGGGTIGRDETTFASKLPFSMHVKLPVAVSEGDRIDIPLTLTSELDDSVAVQVEATFGKGLEGAAGALDVSLAAGARDSQWYALDVTGMGGDASVSFEATGGGQADAFERTLTIEPRGFPGRWEAGEDLEGERTWTVDLGQAVPGTVTASVRLYPSPVSTLTEGMEGMLREPGGCFEQTSSSNYPNIMVLQYLQEHDQADPELMARASGMLDRGYQLLTSYETAEDGYEWFGGAPAHEALTAYGLVEFVDMAQVHGEVDPEMIERTRDYLMGRRDGKGGYKRNDRALDSFGAAAPEVTDAYITWSIVEAGFSDDLDRELDRTRTLARDTDDPYLLALATGTLLKLDDPTDGLAAAKRLASMQADGGGWTGADHSITRSGGVSLDVETTSLALLALLQADGYGADVREGVAWLQSNRGGYGNFGSTQATILALKAMTQYANSSRATRSAGYVSVDINGEFVGEFAYEAGHKGAILFDDLGAFLDAGENTITVTHDGEALPVSVAVDYRSDQPATSPDAVVGVDTELASHEVPMGETVRLLATVENLTDDGQPMALARIGLPGGLSPQAWQLEELREQGIVDFYETRPREVALYFRDLAPSEVHEVPLDLIAEVPGTYTSPASHAYLYYTDEHRVWVAGTEVVVTR